MKKKAIKIATSTAIAASAFVAAAPTQAATNVDAQVKAAVDAGTVLKWAISIEGTGDGATRPWDAYNDAKAKLAKAEAAVAGLSAADKAVATAKLEATKLQITRAMAYIDAITAGEKITTARLALETAIASGNLNAVETAYHGMTAEARKQNKLLDRVYGQSTRDLIRTNYKVAAEKVQASVLYDVTVKMALDKADEFVTASNYERAEAYLAEAAKYLDKVSATFKTQLTNKVAAVEAKVVPMVKSVSAINAKKLSVTFNKEVNESAAESGLSYNFVGLKDANGNAVTVTGYELQSDNKTVIITLSAAVANNTTFVATVLEIPTKADANVKTAKYTTSLTFSDTVRPALSQVKNTAPGKAEVHFTEELSTVGTVKVYDGLNDVTATVYPTAHTAGQSYISLSGLAATKQYRVVITGAKDQSGNLIAAPIEVVVQNASTDTVAPTVTSFGADGVGVIKVQFSEAVRAINSKLTVKVDGYDTTASTTQTFNANTNTMTITGLQSASGVAVTNGSVHSVNVGGFEDLVGNDGTAVTKVLSFSNAAATLGSTSVVREGSDTFVVLTFNKNVTVNTLLDITGSYVTPDSIYKTVGAGDITEATAVTVVDNKVKVKVTGKEAGNYTLSLPINFVDNAGVKNDKAISFSFTLTASTDTSKPVVQNVYVSGETMGLDPVPANTVYVKYDREMSAAALNPNNYTVDGVNIFSDAVFVGDKTLVKLTIKENAISVSGDRNFTISTAVTGLNNVAINAYTSIEPIVENVKPTLTAGKLVDGDTVELTFSEFIKDSTIVAADFEVYIDGVKVTVSNVAQSATAVANDHKFEINLASAVTPAQLASSTITVKAVGAVTDLAGNALTTGTVVNVQK